MRRAVLGLVVLLFSANLAQGQEPVPDITGTWRIVGGQVLTHEGTVIDAADMQSGEVVIEMQEGPVFRGLYRWHQPEGTRLDDGTRETHVAEEELLGAFSSDGKTFSMVDTPDTGLWFGVMLDEKTMELRYLESGPFAIVGVHVLERAR